MAKDFEAVVKVICKENGRYKPEAYYLVRQTMDFAFKRLDLKDKKVPHLSSAQLLENFRIFALEQYGPLARSVLRQWGLNSCEDVGEVVFSLVEYGVLGQGDRDCREAFSGAYNFDEVFSKPFAAV